MTTTVFRRLQKVVTERYWREEEPDPFVEDPMFQLAPPVHHWCYPSDPDYRLHVWCDPEALALPYASILQIRLIFKGWLAGPHVGDQAASEHPKSRL